MVIVTIPMPKATLHNQWNAQFSKQNIARNWQWLSSSKYHVKCEQEIFLFCCFFNYV